MLPALGRGLALRAVAKRVSIAVPKTSRILLDRNLNERSNTTTFRYSSTARNVTREIVSQAVRSIGSVGFRSNYLPFPFERREGFPRLRQHRPLILARPGNPNNILSFSALPRTSVC